MRLSVVVRLGAGLKEHKTMLVTNAPPPKFAGMELGLVTKRVSYTSTASPLAVNLGNSRAMFHKSLRAIVTRLSHKPPG